MYAQEGNVDLLELPSWKTIVVFGRKPFVSNVSVSKFQKNQRCLFVVEKLFRLLENSMSLSCRESVWRRNILKVLFATSAKIWESNTQNRR